MKKSQLWIIIVLILVIVGVIGIWYAQSQQEAGLAPSYNCPKGLVRPLPPPPDLDGEGPGLSASSVPGPPVPIPVVDTDAYRKAYNSLSSNPGSFANYQSVLLALADETCNLISGCSGFSCHAIGTVTTRLLEDDIVYVFDCGCG